MRDTMEIEGYRAVIEFDPDIEMFRGEFVGLNGDADFYVRVIPGLKRERVASLEVSLDMCKEDGIEPQKQCSGMFNMRIPPDLYAAIAAAAAADGKSLNQWVREGLRACVAGSR